MIVKKKLELKAPPAAVWRALTDPEQTAQWMFGCAAVSDWQVGSRLDWVGEPEGQKQVFVTGAIRELEPESRLVYTAVAPGRYDDEAAEMTTVTLELGPKGQQATQLRVSQGDYATVTDGDARHAEAAAGWEMALEGLKRVVEG